MGYCLPSFFFFCSVYCQSFFDSGLLTILWYLQTCLIDSLLLDMLRWQKPLNKNWKQYELKHLKMRMRTYAEGNIVSGLGQAYKSDGVKPCLGDENTMLHVLMKIHSYCGNIFQRLMKKRELYWYHNTKSVLMLDNSVHNTGYIKTQLTLKMECCDLWHTM